jgi:hypothetical protein
MWACEIHKVTDPWSQKDKIENNLQTMLPSNGILQHQYYARNYQTYSDRINDLLLGEKDRINDLLQGEKNDELTMRNCYQHLVASSPLRRFTIMWRVRKRLMDLTTIERILVNSINTNLTTSIRRTNPINMVWGKENNFTRPLSTRNVVIQITLQRNVIFPDNCTKKSLKDATKSKESYEV